MEDEKIDQLVEAALRALALFHDGKTEEAEVVIVTEALQAQGRGLAVAVDMLMMSAGRAFAIGCWLKTLGADNFSDS